MNAIGSTESQTSEVDEVMAQHVTDLNYEWVSSSTVPLQQMSDSPSSPVRPKPKPRSFSSQTPKSPDRETWSLPPPVPDRNYRMSKMPSEKPTVPEAKKLQKPPVLAKPTFAPRKSNIPERERDKSSQASAVQENKKLPIPEMKTLQSNTSDVSFTAKVPAKQAYNRVAPPPPPRRAADHTTLTEMNEDSINERDSSAEKRKPSVRSPDSVQLRQTPKDEQSYVKASDDKGSRLSNSSTASTGSRLSNASAESRMSTASTSSSTSFGGTGGPEFTCDRDASDEQTSSDLSELSDLAATPYQKSAFKILEWVESYSRNISCFVKLFVNHPFFLQNPEFLITCISDTERKNLFSNILEIEDVSNRFMRDLKDGWQRSPMDIFDTLREYVTEHFKVYIHYFANFNFQDRMLRKIKESNKRFIEIIKEFEKHQESNLTVNKLLSLPLQSITELLRLVKTTEHVEPDTPEYRALKEVADQLQELIDTCTEQGRLRNNSLKEMVDMEKLLDFKNIDKVGLPIVSISRSFIGKAILTRLIKGSKGMFGRKRETLHLFLFNDLVIIAGKKSKQTRDGKSLKIIDYAHMQDVSSHVIDGKKIVWILDGAPSGCDFLFVLTLERNHEGKTAEFTFAFDSTDERVKWIIEYENSKSEQINPVQSGTSAAHQTASVRKTVSFGPTTTPATHTIEEMSSMAPEKDDTDEEIFEMGNAAKEASEEDTVAHRPSLGEDTEELQLAPDDETWSFVLRIVKLKELTNLSPYWHEMPEVVESGVLESMEDKEIKIQESLFEILTSEATYLMNLSTVVNFFVNHPRIAKGADSVITDNDRKDLFSNILTIQEVSRRFMHDLRQRFQQNPLLSVDLCDIISDYASGALKEYLNFIANLGFQERRISKLM